MSVLAHLVIGQQDPEPAATRALGYLLRSGKKHGPLRAMIGLLRPAGVQFALGRVECEEMHGDDRPDVSLYDADGRLRVLLENKFWAGLTDRQPVGYLDLLGGRRDAAVVFVAPRERIDPLWRELRRRCAAADRAFEDEERTSDLVFARAGGTVVAAISWGQLLATLESAAEKKATRRDIAQLRGLTDRIERQGFVPFRGERLSDSATARLLLQCYDLVRTTTEACEPAEIMFWAGNGKKYGIYFDLPPKFKNLWLCVDFEAWRRCGVSPLWLALRASEQVPKWEKDLEDARTKIERGEERLRKGITRTEGKPTVDWVKEWKVFADNLLKKIKGQTVPGLRGNQARLVSLLQDIDDEAHSFEDRVLVPVRLRTGEEEDTVVKDAVRQVNRIGEALAAAFGEDSAEPKANPPP